MTASYRLNFRPTTFFLMLAWIAPAIPMAGQQLDEIVVPVQKREQVLHVPLAVSALTEEKVRLSAIVNVPTSELMKSLSGGQLARWNRCKLRLVHG